MIPMLLTRFPSFPSFKHVFGSFIFKCLSLFSYVNALLTYFSFDSGSNSFTIFLLFAQNPFQAVKLISLSKFPMSIEGSHIRHLFGKLLASVACVTAHRLPLGMNGSICLKSPPNTITFSPKGPGKDQRS
ncbi:hypothetical protein GLYMA_02G229050v4 [Glycine max]|nr:hypothetical protein GLYMA_02G229050v4 [Glycine max]